MGFGAQLMIIGDRTVERKTVGPMVHASLRFSLDPQHGLLESSPLRRMLPELALLTMKEQRA